MTTDLTTLQTLALEQIYGHLKGSEIRGKDVAAAIGLRPRATGKEGADMRSIIHALRVKGYPICANGRGYFWAGSYSELQRFVEIFRNRIADQEKAANGMLANRTYEPMEILEL